MYSSYGLGWHTEFVQAPMSKSAAGMETEPRLGGGAGTDGVLTKPALTLVPWGNKEGLEFVQRYNNSFLFLSVYYKNVQVQAGDLAHSTLTI